MANYRDKSFAQEKIVLERIAKLFSEAELEFKEHPELSKRYIVLARKLSTRYKVRFSADQKKLFCKNCNAYLKTGVNVRTRLTNRKLVQTCLECSAVKRMNYRKKK
jgi:ribonuclease P protein subunit RPR2